MTRSRMFGSDVPFCDWMRSNPELPSYSASHAIGFVATDVDVLVHRYLTKVDSIGTRGGEFAVATGLSRSKVYDMIATDSIEVKRFGRSVRVPWHVVRRMVGVES